jgi:hypothetical protein
MASRDRGAPWHLSRELSSPRDVGGLGWLDAREDGNMKD